MNGQLPRRRLLLSGSTAAGLLLLTGGSVASATACTLVPASHPVTGTRHFESRVAQRQVRERLRALERAYPGRIGAYAVDTASDVAVSYRADERFPLLSTFKVLAAAAVLKRARTQDPRLLDRLIRWTEADLVEYSPVTEQHVADGLTVAQLCHAAITVSDNTAGNLLLQQIDGPAGLTRYLRSLGDRDTRLDRWETDLNVWNPTERRDTTTPAAMGRTLHALTVGRALHRDDRAQLIEWMRQTVTGDQRIRAGLPDDWSIGDKTGSSYYYGAANDVAIAYPPSQPPLIIAIYTNRLESDLTNDNAIIAQTATILADALGKL